MPDDIKPTNTRASSARTRSDVDWDGLEMAYRAGVRSLKDIGEEFGVSPAGILKRGKRDGWVRDLSARIQAQAEAKVNAAQVNAKVNAGKAFTERLTIEANAEAIATLKLSHRSDLRRQRAVVNNLLSELELTTGPANAQRLAELGELMRAEDDNGRDRLNDVYQQLLSLPERVKSSKDLTDQLTRLVESERRAWNIPDPDKIKPGEGDAASGQPQRAMSDVERAVRLAAMLTKARAAGGDDKGAAT